MNTFPEVFDSSMMASFKSCPQLFKKLYIDNWKSKEGVNVHLTAGGAFAAGLEAARRAFFVNGFSAEVAEAHGLEALLLHYGDFECPPDSAKSAERTAGALEFYLDHYPLTMDTGYPILLPGEKRAIEVNFVHPLPIDHPETGQPLLYCGRSDMICQFAGGNYIEDDKTTSSLGPTWSRQWDLRGQFLGYTWGFRNSGFDVRGVLVRGVSILKTKYDTQEAIVNFSEKQVNRWYTEMLEWIEDIKRCWTVGRWKYNLDHACVEYGGCGFKTVCQVDEEQPWLEQYFEKRKWNPITREESKL
ncbi:MAG: hypothetical protein WCC37_23305 [Candidatus Sulfotelmatobacter sp.]